MILIYGFKICFYGPQTCVFTLSSTDIEQIQQLLSKHYHINEVKYSLVYNAKHSGH